MPIRTNRGRAAVYRRLWSWPMRSPRHLVATGLVVFAVILMIGLLVPKLTGSGGSPAGATTDSGSGTTTTTPTNGIGGNSGAQPGAQPTSASPPSSGQTRLSGPTQTPTSVAKAEPKALDVAVQWAKAWVNHPAGITNDQWRAGLIDLTTEEQYAVMSSVDPANIAATEVTGDPVATNAFTTSVLVKVPTNGGTLSITVISTPDGWRVAHYEQAA